MGRIQELLQEQEEKWRVSSSETTLRTYKELCGRRGTPFALEKVWQVAWIRGDHGFCTSWTGKQRGQARDLMNALGAELAAEVMAEAVEHWAEIRGWWKKKQGWQHASEKPSLGLILAGRDAAVEWAANRQQNANVCTAEQEDEGWDKI